MGFFSSIKIKDLNNVGRGLILGDGCIVKRNYLQAIAEGDIANHTVFHKVGYSPASTGSQTTVWGGGSQYVFPTGAIQVEIVSSDAQDADGIGTGAYTVVMGYLDASYVSKKHTFTLNGTTPVDGPADFFRCNQLYVATAGSSKKTVGNITMRLKGGAATVYGRIESGHTTDRSSIFTVPSGYTAYIYDVMFSASYSSAGKSERITLHTSVNPEGVVNTNTIFYNQYELMVVDGSGGKVDGAPIKCPEFTDIKCSVIGEINAQITTCISGWLETD